MGPDGEPVEFGMLLWVTHPYSEALHAWWKSIKDKELWSSVDKHKIHYHLLIKVNYITIHNFLFT